MMNRLLVRLAILLSLLVIATAAALTILIFATSSPPTLSRTVASPNTQIQALASGHQDADIQQTELVYHDTVHPRNADPACGEHGQWGLTVNPQDVVGHPYAAAPTPQDWMRASRVIATATTICPSQVILTWYGHDLAHPTSDTWTVVLPATIAAGSDGGALRRYALRHARQA